MVRTLVFHSNNVGSIPAGPIIFLSRTYNNHLYKTSHTKSDNKYYVFYKFNFISLITPNLSNNLNFKGQFLSVTSISRTKVLLKQSYLILSWLSYLRSKVGFGKSNSPALIKFSSLPKKTTLYTLTKAPMAHKTNSKEPFKFSFFKFSTSFRIQISPDFIPKSFNQLLMAVGIIKSFFPVFETNLLVLKSYKLAIPLRGSYRFTTFSK